MARNNRSKPDLFGDESASGAPGSGPNRDDFAALFEQSMNPARRLRVGDAFKGEILSIGKEHAFVSTGTPIDGSLPTIELASAKDPDAKYAVGDVIEVRVVRVNETEILLRRTDSLSSAAEVESLEDAFDLELPVEGRVSEPVKGGVRVMLGGKTAFCPISQLDLRRVENTQDYVGKKFEFIVTQFENGGRNIVVSRRKVLELQRAEGEGAFLETAKPGQIFHGRITRIEKFGAFVQLAGGVEGLIPISEIAWGRVGDPRDVVSIGQEVDVALLRATEEDGRLRVSLSLKQAGGEGDPWTRVEQDFPVGRVVEGTVERKEAYGLFVRISPVIVGLLPRSKWRDRVDGAQFENRKKGDKLSVQVDEIKADEKRISLTPPEDRDDGAWRLHSTKTGGFGTLGDLLSAVRPQKK